MISNLDSLLSQMKGYRSEMADGKYVFARHTNVFIDFCSNALEAVKQIYEEFKAKKGITLPDVEDWIKMAEDRIGYMEKRKFGDIVLTRDHNLVIDSLKPLELVLREIEEHL